MDDACYVRIFKESGRSMYLSDTGKTRSIKNAKLFNSKKTAKDAAERYLEEDKIAAGYILLSVSGTYS